MKSVLAACVALAFFAAPAWAQSQKDAPVAVQIVDLDLSQPEDAAVLLWRVERAAERLCEAEALNAPTMSAKAMRDCRSQTVATTVARLNAPEVTQAHAAIVERTARFRLAALR